MLSANQHAQIFACILLSSKSYPNFLVLQAHDGEKLHVGQWVAVAYNEDFYVGQVTNILSNNGGVKIKFLTKKKDGFYKWLQLKDTDLVSTEYIFHSKPAVQKVGSAFVLNDENTVINLYDSYKKKYLTS